MEDLQRKAGGSPDNPPIFDQDSSALITTNSKVSGDSGEEEDEVEDGPLNPSKTFKERAAELQKKLIGPHSSLVERSLKPLDWLVIHRIIRKSKGLKSKFMIKNLNPILFDSSHVMSWQCKICKEQVSSPEENYVSHLLSHGKSADDDALYPCDVCGLYVKKDKYVVHWVPHFMEHECPKCSKTFALNCHMKYHYKVVHEEGEQTCYQCGRLLKNDLAMRRHLRLFHSNRTNWKICDICGKRVKSRCLEPHKLTHSQDRPYKCDVCRKCFKTPSTLYQHQKVHATDSKAHKYLCEYCGKRFKHHTSWNLHVVRIHEGEYEHECPVCHKRFHKLFELKKHSVKHSEDRPFPCSICGKHFKTKTHLKEHITIHSNEKSHLCPLCGKGIRMKANLYKHLKVHRNRGEYVPPLNGTTTNFLFNNYGYSPALCPTFHSNGRKSSSRDTLTSSGSRLSSLPITEAQKIPSVGNKSIAAAKLPSPASDICPAPVKLVKAPEKSCIVSSTFPPTQAQPLQSSSMREDSVSEIPSKSEEILVLDQPSSAIFNLNTQHWHCRRHLGKLNGIVLNSDGTIIHPITHIIPSTSPSSQIEISRTTASIVSNCMDSPHSGKSNNSPHSNNLNHSNINNSNNVISLIASQSGDSNTTGDTITHVTIMVGQLNNPYLSTDLQHLTTSNFSP